MDDRHKAREEAVRRACEVMGWDYHQIPVWAGLRKVAMADAVAISVEKLNQLVDAIHEANRKANAAQTLNSNQRQMVAQAEIEQAEIERGALQIRIAMRILNEVLEALSGIAS
jgi:hypothetical protein